MQILKAKFKKYEQLDLKYEQLDLKYIAEYISAKTLCILPSHKHVCELSKLIKNHTIQCFTAKQRKIREDLEIIMGPCDIVIGTCGRLMDLFQRNFFSKRYFEKVMLVGDNLFEESMINQVEKIINICGENVEYFICVTENENVYNLKNLKILKQKDDEFCG